MKKNAAKKVTASNPSLNEKPTLSLLSKEMAFPMQMNELVGDMMPGMSKFEYVCFVLAGCSSKGLEMRDKDAFAKEVVATAKALLQEIERYK
jgi:hypothetical protein